MTRVAASAAAWVFLFITAVPARAGAPPCARIGLSNVCTYQMPLYDQTNPNFAAYASPAAFMNESAPVANTFACGGTTANNPYDQSWLPYGPIPGDPNVTAPACGWWFTAICCPTAEAMALEAAIRAKATSTTISGWTKRFANGTAPAMPSSGWAPQLAPVFPFVSDPRQHMTRADIERVVQTALAQNTNPASGGGEDYIATRGGDFSPAAVGTNGSANDITTAKFIAAMRAGAAIVIAIHDYTAHVDRSGNVTLTSNGGGHCLAVGGYSTNAALTFWRAPTLQIVDPVYGVVQWLSIVNLQSGTSTQGGATRTVTLPNGWTSVGVWPDSAHPVTTIWDVADGQTVTLIDEYHSLQVA